MKKHRASRNYGVQANTKRKSAFSRASALGVAVVAAMALSGAPVVGATNAQPASVATSNIQVAPAVYVSPVSVSLLSGVDAISWDALQFTSSELKREIAEDSKGLGAPGNTTPDNATVLSASLGEQPGSATGGQASSMLVGQNVGVLGELPGGLQLMHPVASRHITSPYGWRSNPTGPGTQIHIGQDYAISCGSPVYAAEDGTVIQSAWAGHSGMRVTIDHGNSVRTGYSHNSKLIARVGDVVKQGQLIALSGTTGNSTGCHVHFEVIINGKWNDPRNFLPAVPGQPNPMINSRNTTITAEPIRNYGTPRSGTGGMQDLEIEIPWRPEVSVVQTPRVQKPVKSTVKEPAKRPVAKPETTPSPKPVAKPAKSPKPVVKPVAKPETTPSPKPVPKPAEPSKPVTKPAEPSKPVTKPAEPTKPVVKPAEPSKPVTKPTDSPKPVVKPTDPEPTQESQPTTKPEESPKPQETAPVVKPSESTKPVVEPTNSPKPGASTGADAPAPATKAPAGNGAGESTPPSKEVATDKPVTKPSTGAAVPAAPATDQEAVTAGHQDASAKPSDAVKPSASTAAKKPVAAKQPMAATKAEPDAKPEAAKTGAAAETTALKPSDPSCKKADAAKDPIPAKDPKKKCKDTILPQGKKALPDAKTNEPTDG